MTEPTPPDGHQPAEPPRIPETPSMPAYTGEPSGADATPPRAERPDPANYNPAPPAAAAYSAASPPPPNQPPPPAQPPAAPAGPGPGAPYNPAPPGPSGPAPSGPAGYGGPPPGAPPPGYGGPPPGAGGPPPGAAGPPTGDEPKKKNGLLIGGVVALALAVAGGVGFVALSGGDDDGEAVEREDDEPEDTEPDTTEPEDTVPDVTIAETVPPVVTEAAPVADGTVENEFVRIGSFADVIADDQIENALQTLGQTTGDNPVSTTDGVLNLCAAVAIDSPTMASVEWVRDGSTVSTGASRILETPADGNCINNNGEPLSAGSYEVSFTDDSGAMSGVALFTVGAETVTQPFFNDTGADVCSVDVGPSSAGFYQPFELTSGAPLVDGESILIDVADIEHEARAIDCNGDPLASFFFTPTSDSDVSLTDGSVVADSPPATTEPPVTTPPPAAPITDLELNSAQGQMVSLDLAVSTPAEEATVIDLLVDTEERLRQATTEDSFSLCAAWAVPGALEADIVWEFNRLEVSRIPATAVDGKIGVCVPPGGEKFDEGAYQVYLQRDGVFSTVLTFTVGRDETLLAFRNDTGVSVCEVGFSPNLTNFYSFYLFAESSDFDEALAPGETFTIAAPFIENDIKAIDCDGNDVSETFNIAPTDQTLNLTTGQP